MSPQPQTPPRGAQVGDDPAEYEEYEDFSSLPDTRSIASDDSFYPPGDEEECGAVSSVSAQNVPEDDLEAATLLRAACANDVGLLRALVRRGPRVEEVQETDRNGRVSGRLRRVCFPSSLLPRPHLRATQIRTPVGPRGYGAAALSTFSSLGAPLVLELLARAEHRSCASSHRRPAAFTTLGVPECHRGSPLMGWLQPVPL
jgi:hypothetical protein